MAYEFRLKKVRDVKFQGLKKAKNELAESIQVLQKANELLDTYISGEKKIKEYLGRIISGTNSIIDYQHSFNSLNGFRDNIKNQQKKVEEISMVVDEKRSKLIRLSQDVKILDKLDEKSYKEYVKAQKELEVKQIDAYVCNKYKSKVI